MGPGMIAALPSIISGVGSLVGGRAANRARSGEAQKDRSFQSAEADKSMRFSERMRNTEWQAAVADMEAAGINPALAYSQGGASSPSGDAGSGSRASQEDVLTPAISSGMQYKRLKAEVALLQSQKLNTDMQTTERAGNPRRLLGGMFSWATQGGLGKAVRAAVGGIGSSARSVADFTKKIAPRSTARLTGKSRGTAPYITLGMKYRSRR